MCCEFVSMRRNLQIRASFAPTRTSHEYLREVYELVTQVTERTIGNATDAPHPSDGVKRDMARIRRQQ